MHFDVYTSQGCQKCKLTAKRLTDAGHDVSLIDVAVTDGAYEKALEISGGAKSLPIVRAENGDSWYDFRVDRLKHYGA